MKNKSWVLCVGLMALAATAFFLIPSTHGSLPGIKIDCTSNVRGIGQMLVMYQNQNNRLPNSLDDLPDLPAKMRQCPAGEKPYIYLGRGMGNPKDNVVILYEDLTNHGQRGMNVLYGDMQVEFVDMAKAKKITAELQAGHNPPRV
jgi:hypothetical protein